MVQDNSAAWEPSKDIDNTFEMVQEINAAGNGNHSGNVNGRQVA